MVAKEYEVGSGHNNYVILNIMVKMTEFEDWKLNG